MDKTFGHSGETIGFIVGHITVGGNVRKVRLGYGRLLKYVRTDKRKVGGTEFDATKFIYTKTTTTTKNYTHHDVTLNICREVRQNVNFAKMQRVRDNYAALQSPNRVWFATITWQGCRSPYKQITRKRTETFVPTMSPSRRLVVR